MGKSYIVAKDIILYTALSLVLCTLGTKAYAQTFKMGIGMELGVSSLGDNGTDEYGLSHDRDKTPAHFYSGKHATFDIGLSFQFNRYLLNMSFPIDGTVGENSYGKGDLTDNLSGISMNAGYEFCPAKYFYIYPLVGFASRANKYSDLYYGEVATGKSRAYFLYGAMMRYKAIYLRGNNDGVSLGCILGLPSY